MPVMTTRRLLALVAVVAVLLGCWAMVQRRQDYLRKAASFQAGLNLFGEYRHMKLEDGSHMLNEEYFEADGTMKDRAEKYLDRLHEHRAALLGKYLYAADHPWLPVEPDPPKPQRDW